MVSFPERLSLDITHSDYLVFVGNEEEPGIEQSKL